MKYIAIIKSRSGNANIYFSGVSFHTSQRAKATQFETRIALQAAISAAYKAGTVTAHEINSYWDEATR